jgi:GNAT superfamily N-acetyltransferase
MKIYIFLSTLLLSNFNMQAIEQKDNMNAAFFANSSPYAIKIVTGKEMIPLLPFVAEQRIQIYRDYPYLYDGNMMENGEEMKYLHWFVAQPQSAFAVAYDGAEPVGFISATDLADFDAHFAGTIELFTKAELDPKKYYYFADSVVKPEYKNKQIETALVEAIEQHAKKLGYAAGCFADESHEQHPLKPKDFVDHDAAFKTSGYIRSSLSITFGWSTIQVDGSSKHQEHVLTFWLKNF